MASSGRSGRAAGRWTTVVAALLLAPGSPSDLHAQAADPASEHPGGGWSAMLGLARQGVSDELASPLRYRGTGLLLGGGYASRGAHGGWEVRLSWAGLRIASSLESPRGGFEDTHQVDLGVSRMWRMTTLAGGRLGLHLGGALDVRFSYRSHSYDVWETGSRTERFGDLFAPLQLSGMWDVDVGERGRLGHRVSVPVVSLVMRSPYTGLKYTPDVTLAGPTTATGFDSDLTYRRAVGDGWTLGLFYRTTLLTYPDPLPLDWIVHRVGVRLEVGG